MNMKRNIDLSKIEKSTYEAWQGNFSDGTVLTPDIINEMIEFIDSDFKTRRGYGGEINDKKYKR